MANPATINALNVATDPVIVQSGRKFSVGLYSTSSFVGTVSLQRARIGSSTWRTIKTYTGEAEEIGEVAGTFQLRLIATAYTSGTIVAEVAV